MKQQQDNYDATDNVVKTQLTIATNIKITKKAYSDESIIKYRYQAANNFSTSVGRSNRS